MIATTTMACGTTLYVVLFITTHNLCKFLIDGHAAANGNGTECVASGHVDDAVAMAGHGQIVTRRGIATENFEGMDAWTAILSCIVDDDIV